MPDKQAQEVFTAENLACKRPLPGATGLPPRDYDRVVGRRAARALRIDDPIDEDAVEGGL
ncbi:MAG: hypothetical protein IH957_12770 [Chloroflexi bacterium]|nr:hypothetical protein [Chloroflexota bacterium]